MAEKKNKKNEAIDSIPLTPDIEQSIDILIQCANIAQKGGLLSLQDATYANQAVNMLAQYLPKPDGVENNEEKESK